MVQEKDIWLICSQGTNPPLSASYNRVHTIHDLPETGCDAILLPVQSANDLKLLYKIRQTPAFRFTPLFYYGELQAKEQILFDGLADDSLLEKTQAILERLELIPEDIKTSEDLEMIILIYLFSRQPYSLKGFLDCQNTYVLSYPLINLYIHQEFFDSWRFLQGFVQRDLLIEKTLVDEIQACPFCSSGLLNFKNSCPSCHSIDIKSQHFIHCFPCGHIAPINEFMTREQLICPRCNAKLRHIGIDYDKPLEDKSCNHCHEYFSEAEIQVACIACKKLLNPEELESRRLYDYALSKRGELFALGIEKKIERHFSYLFDLIDYQSLIAIIEWQKNLMERYPSIHFCLLGLQVKNMEALIQQHGLFNTEKIILELFNQIKQLLRKTDLVSKVNECIIFFLPMTDLKGGKTLANKIHDFILEQKTDSQNSPIEVATSLLGAEELVSQSINSELIMPSLLERLDRT